MKMKLAKKLIREFQDLLSNSVETDEQTEVYKICFQLFPLRIAPLLQKQTLRKRKKLSLSCSALIVSIANVKQIPW